jgi:hypothetical protein
MFIDQIIAITEQKMREAALAHPRNTALRNCLKDIDGADASQQRVPENVGRGTQKGLEPVRTTFPSVLSPDTRRSGGSPSKRSKTASARRSSAKTQAGKRRK